MDLFSDPDMDALSDSLKALSSPNSEKSGSGGFKVKSSAPDDSVGQLAAMLARAETRIDVQQVASRAIRALTNLKMSAAASEGKDAKKIAQMIKRMEIGVENSIFTELPESIRVLRRLVSHIFPNRSPRIRGPKG